MMQSYAPLSADTLVDLDGPDITIPDMPAFSGTVAQAADRLIPGTYGGYTYDGRPVRVTVTTTGSFGAFQH